MMKTLTLFALLASAAFASSQARLDEWHRMKYGRPTPATEKAQENQQKAQAPCQCPCNTCRG